MSTEWLDFTNDEHQVLPEPDPARASLALVAVMLGVIFGTITALLVLVKLYAPTAMSWWAVFTPAIALGFAELAVGLVLIIIAFESRTE